MEGNREFELNQIKKKVSQYLIDRDLPVSDLNLVVNVTSLDLWINHGAISGFLTDEQKKELNEILHPKSKTLDKAQAPAIIPSFKDLDSKTQLDIKKSITYIKYAFGKDKQYQSLIAPMCFGAFLLGCFDKRKLEALSNTINLSNPAEKGQKDLADFFTDIDNRKTIDAIYWKITGHNRKEKETHIKNFNIPEGNIFPELVKDFKGIKIAGADHKIYEGLDLNTERNFNIDCGDLQFFLLLNFNMKNVLNSTFVTSLKSANKEESKDSPNK